MDTEEIMQQVRQIEIATRRAVTEVFAGEYSSAFKGRGMEFAEVREYQPGDDIRDIDWNVTARTDKPFVKRYDEERELTVLLAVDLSGSTDFGSVKQTKRTVAIEISALIAFAALRKNDRVGLLLFSDEPELFIPPKKGARHTLRLIRELIAFEPRGTNTDFVAPCRHIDHMLRKRAIVFVISDFLTPGHLDDTGPDFESPLRRLVQRHEVIALQITDPREDELPPVGLIDLIDAESGKRTIVNASSKRTRRAHAARSSRHDRNVVTTMRKLAIDHARVSTALPYIDPLAQLFRAREKRR